MKAKAYDPAKSKLTRKAIQAISAIARQDAAALGDIRADLVFIRDMCRELTAEMDRRIGSLEVQAAIKPKRSETK
ncbi:MAG: hypothetical protein ACRDQZ_25485 [Mycobacteriales bacterium]